MAENIICNKAMCCFVKLVSVTDIDDNMKLVFLTLNEGQQLLKAPEF